MAFKTREDKTKQWSGFDLSPQILLMILFSFEAFLCNSKATCYMLWPRNQILFVSDFHSPSCPNAVVMPGGLCINESEIL